MLYPPEIYNTICEYVETEFHIAKEKYVRPFYPGGDYKSFEYKNDSVVVDNPPFSIISKIVEYYVDNNIKFFLFAPHLTLLNAGHKACSIFVNVAIVYDNGAKINTGFVTNLDKENMIRTEPELRKRLIIVQNQERPTRAKYNFPAHLLNSARLGKYADVKLRIPRNKCQYVNNIESMRRAGKHPFGGSVIASDDVIKQLGIDGNAEADFNLSEEELKIVERLNNG